MVKRYNADEIIRKWKAQQEPKMYLSKGDEWEKWCALAKYFIDD